MKAEFVKVISEVGQALRRVEPGTVMQEVNARLVRQGMNFDRMFPVFSRGLKATVGASSKGEFVVNTAIATGTGWIGFGMLAIDVPNIGFRYGIAISSVVLHRLRNIDLRSVNPGT